MNTRFLKKIVTILFIALVSIALKAQTDTTRRVISDKLNHFSIGANFHQYGTNDGDGLDVTSPYFDISDNHNWKQSVAVRLKYDICAFTGILQGEGTASKFSYSIISLGFVEKQLIIPQKLSFIMEFNGSLLLPESQMSSEPTRWGASWLPGIEIYLTSHTSVLFEMGIGGTFQSCIADKLVGRPYYYYTNENGGGEAPFLLSFGVHLYL